jgi:hypothetical protein
MNVIGNAADPITHSHLLIARNGCEIRIEFRANRFIEDRRSVLRAENHMHQNKCQRLAIGDDYSSGLQPSFAIK